MKIKIAVIFGGKSAEHEVSLNSASNIFNAIDREKFEATLLGIDKKGEWKFCPHWTDTTIDLSKQDYFQDAQAVYIDHSNEQALVVDKRNRVVLESFDLAFSIIHGNQGEDGTLQGFFKFKNIPFVGPDVLSSALCMDKEVTKRLLRDNQLPIADFITLHKFEKEKVDFETAKNKLGLPIFIKPSNSGSSVGVNKVEDEESFKHAVQDAFRFDNKILIEEAIVGKEVECAVLGNEYPSASVIGEIIPTKEFYSYDAKYLDADGAKMKIPAEIDAKVAEQLRAAALKAFTTLCCEGMARVDFFLRNDNTFVVNEINTLPGFTQISLYPKLWEHSGITYSDLITKLIELSLERHQRNKTLQTIK